MSPLPAAIVVWGFVELTFLTGIVIGTAPRAMPRGRYRMAPRALRDDGDPSTTKSRCSSRRRRDRARLAWRNQSLALATFAMLWLMRLSAKLNLFLGVPNLHDELLPQPAAHLRSYFRADRHRLRLYPVSMPAAVIAAGLARLRARLTAPTEFASAYLRAAGRAACARTRSNTPSC